MDTRFWGPPGWKLIHQVAYKYPINPTEIEKLDYGIFYSNLAFVLPCKYCRNSFTKYLKNLPIENYLVTYQIVCVHPYIVLRYQLCFP